MAKYCCFRAEDKAHYGLVRHERVEVLSSEPWTGGEPTGKDYPLASVRLLVPCQPSKVICLGRNYRGHAAELGNPVPRTPLIFLKPPSAVVGPEEPIVFPAMSERVDYEGELAVVIGRRCHGVDPEDDPFHYVFGYTCLNDVTARDLQKADGHFARAKGFDSFCPLGPVIATGLDPRHLILETYVNGERRQHVSTGEMIFPLNDIIRFIAGVMTLEPGDVIATGTPSGVGPLRVGDVVEVAIEGIGHLRNPVLAESRS
jgi:2-keto-4-pentenoate hydratase/2-oxohepta-3-ene-1,7-dioic acid hydratase in catechol pathway